MGWLKVVGTGIRIGHLTFEAQCAIQTADVVFSVVTDRLGKAMLDDNNPNVVDLCRFYALEKERAVTYREMADEVLGAVRAGKRVCFAIYGHPSVFAYPSRLALDTAREEGYPVEILPGISSLDSLFCDLEIDPAVHGCQVYCATALVYENRALDSRSVLTIWQAAIIGESRAMEKGDADCYQRLCNRLISVYGADHPVILYEAATNPFFDPDMCTIPLSDLESTKLRPYCTLVVPPIHCPDLVKIPLATKPATWVTMPSEVIVPG